MKTTKMGLVRAMAVCGGFSLLACVLPCQSVMAEETVLSPKTALFGISDSEFEKRSRLLFDGKSFQGWEGDQSWFRIEDESVVAGKLGEKIPSNQFLCTDQVFGDFELRMEVRMTGQGRNAGVQVRTRRPRPDENLPPNEVVGYQADMGVAWKRSVWGALYDESRRRKMLQEPETPYDVNWSETIVASDGSKHEATPWVRMRVVCKGPRIQISLNDVVTVDYTEEDAEIPRNGVIALQIHSGPPAEAWYRNIRLLELP